MKSVIFRQILRSAILLRPNNLKNICHVTFNKQCTKLNFSSTPKFNSNTEQGFKKYFSAKHSWKLALTMMLLSGSCTFSYLLFEWGAPLMDKNGEEITDEFTLLSNKEAYLKRFWKNIVNYFQSIREPPSKKLIPDVVKPPYFQPPYTLVIEMVGVLVHPEWSINTGWRFKTRPGLDYLLSNVGPPLYEVVLFTHEDGANLYSIVDGIDPKGVLSYRLFRDSTNYINGTHVKDLSCLNRDLSKTIIVDCDPYAVQLQPQNALCLPSWKGKNDDKLYHLSNFLKAVATSGVEDVRDVLNHYSRYDDPLKAFTEKQKSINKQASTKEQPKPSLVKKLNRYK